MNPLNILDRVFGDQKKIRILRHLVAGQQNMTGREWARLLEISPATILGHLQDLIDEGIVIRTTVGNSHTFQLNERNEVVKKILVPNFRNEKNIIPAVAKTLEANLTKKHIDSVILYGSLARGTASASSDWDILILCKHTGDIESLRKQLDAIVPTMCSQLASTLDIKIFATQDFCTRYHKGESFPKNVFMDYLHSVVPNPLAGTSLTQLLESHGKEN